MGRVQDKVVLIIGEVSGMGLAAIQLFAQERAQVIAANITQDALNEKVAA